MELFVASGGRSTPTLSPDALAAAVERLWPGRTYQSAVFTDRGALLALFRLDTQLPQPAISVEAGVVRLRRWDWPSLVGSQGQDAEWVHELALRGESSAPPADAPGGAVWLPRSQTLLVIRDAAGEGSVWYSADRQRMTAANHPALLLALPGISSGADQLGRSLAGFVGGPGDLTPWLAIRRLAPGHMLHWDANGARVSRWWRPPPADTIAARDDAEWFTEARLAMERAVARRIPADGHVGAQLSGGLDSTGVSLVAARLLRAGARSLHVFSHVPAVRWVPPQVGDESPYIDAALARMPDAIPHFCTDQAGEGRRPGGNPLAAHDRAVRDAAAACGLRVMLSGWGGDEGLSYNGDGYLAGELFHLRLRSALRNCWELGGRRLRGLAGVVLRRVILQQLGVLRPTPLHPDPMRPSRHDWVGQLSGEARLVGQECVRAAGRLRSAASAHENQRRLLTSPHLGNRIDADAEWSIPAGFCFRYPLLDPDVIRVALQVPERLFLLEGRTRTLMRRALADVLPALIRDRRGKFASHPRQPAYRAAS